MTHAEFIAAYRDGRLHVHVDRAGAVHVHVQAPVAVGGDEFRVRHRRIRFARRARQASTT